MEWDNVTVPMRDPSQLRDTEIDAFENQIFSMHDPEPTKLKESKTWTLSILPDMDEMVSKYTHLTDKEREKLKQLLLKFETLFEGTLGTWVTKPIDKIEGTRRKATSFKDLSSSSISRGQTQSCNPAIGLIWCVAKNQPL